MDSTEIRNKFLGFFKSKQHKIVPSAPMVVKDDPTLMFTNAGMNQFKDIFLEHRRPESLRIANTQKCLRVSGKHNDLEEVGHDTYHHTMFEMLGNWSFGDYFKKEAIEWGWELLTKEYGIDKENLYATVFGGDEEDGLEMDKEAHEHWLKILPGERVLFGTKKDNFWEMGDTGPCGPCSEIHVDIRSEEEKKKVPGRDLVNKDHPLVIELWNLVFIEFNRQSDGKLVNLPKKHIDTGMGLERLTMVLQGKTSNYETDVFQAIIGKLSEEAKVPYGKSEDTDVAMRVISDHLRAVSFAIADGQLPSNTRAGYVIRRILRRALRYGFTFLGLNEPFMNGLVDTLVSKMGSSFPELKKQQQLTENAIREEETAFLKTLSQGIKKFEEYTRVHKGEKVIGGDFAFELFDTYGFPVDLTRLMAEEKGWTVDMEGFTKGLQAQKERSKKAAKVDAMDWHVLKDNGEGSEFVGYETLEADAEIVKYRKVSTKKDSYYEIVLDRTPFYAEAGGQVGDKGYLEKNGEKIEVADTYKEHELFIHKTGKIFDDMSGKIKAKVDGKKRLATVNNHSATHLMHAALRKVLGEHVEQRGSLVDENRLRFDFSHFKAMTVEEIREVEQIVNHKIRENIPIEEERNVPFSKAVDKGAMALFGEKYGEEVRVITFDKDYSVELCGGTHVQSTGQIGFFRIISEGAIAAGIRRVEAVTGKKAEQYVYNEEDLIRRLKESMKNTKDLVKGVNNLIEENKELQKKLDSLGRDMAKQMKSEFLENAEQIDGIKLVTGKIEGDGKAAKDLVFSMKDDGDDLFIVIGNSAGGKAGLTVMISEKLVRDKGLHAGNIIRELAKEIKGGGGGQPHFASAGGKDPSGFENAFEKVRELLKK